MLGKWKEMLVLHIQQIVLIYKNDLHLKILPTIAFKTLTGPVSTYGNEIKEKTFFCKKHVSLQKFCQHPCQLGSFLIPQSCLPEYELRGGPPFPLSFDEALYHGHILCISPRKGMKESFLFLMPAGLILRYKDASIRKRKDSFIPLRGEIHRIWSW